MLHQLNNLITLPLAQNIRILVQRTPSELVLGPQVRREETVRVDDSGEGGLEGVLEGLGGAGRRGIGVLDTGQLEETLDGGRGDEAGTTGGRNELYVSQLGLVCDINSS